MTATVLTALVPGTKTAWKLDPSHSTVEFSAKHLMITTCKGQDHGYRRNDLHR